MNPDSPRSPLFLHSDHHLGMSIVSVQIDCSNSLQWCSAITFLLMWRKKISFIHGSSRSEARNTLFRIWSRCNSMVKLWLLNSVTMKIYGSVLSFYGASEIWDDLHDRFHKTNLRRTFQFVQQIQDLLQGSMDRLTYYTMLKTLWDNLDGAEPAKHIYSVIYQLF